MARRKSKTISFDAMVKFFMQNYDIPTKSDVDRIMQKLDRIEMQLKYVGSGNGRKRIAGSAAKKKTSGRSISGSVEHVLQVIRELNQGASLPDIKARTDFDEKKIRNILYRLYKSGAIKRISRGVYTAA